MLNFNEQPNRVPLGSKDKADKIVAEMEKSSWTNIRNSIEKFEPEVQPFFACDIEVKEFISKLKRLNLSEDNLKNPELTKYKIEGNELLKKLNHFLDDEGTEVNAHLDAVTSHEYLSEMEEKCTTQGVESFDLEEAKAFLEGSFMPALEEYIHINFPEANEDFLNDQKAKRVMQEPGNPNWN